MNTTILLRVGLAGMLALALAVPGRAQSSAPTKLQGTIHDNADALGANWVIAGEWALTMQGASGKADFFASLTMKQNGAVPGAPHTHHLSLQGATVTVLANGYSITGEKTLVLDGASATTLVVVERRFRNRWRGPYHAGPPPRSPWWSQVWNQMATRAPRRQAAWGRWSWDGFACCF